MHPSLLKKIRPLKRKKLIDKANDVFLTSRTNCLIRCPSGSGRLPCRGCECVEIWAPDYKMVFGVKFGSEHSVCNRLFSSEAGAGFLHFLRLSTVIIDALLPAGGDKVSLDAKLKSFVRQGKYFIEDTTQGGLTIIIIIIVISEHLKLTGSGVQSVT